MSLFKKIAFTVSCGTVMLTICILIITVLVTSDLFSYSYTLPLMIGLIFTVFLIICLNCELNYRVFNVINCIFSTFVLLIVLLTIVLYVFEFNNYETHITNHSDTVRDLQKRNITYNKALNFTMNVKELIFDVTYICYNILCIQYHCNSKDIAYYKLDDKNMLTIHNNFIPLSISMLLLSATLMLTESIKRIRKTYFITSNHNVLPVIIRTREFTIVPLNNTT